MIFCSLTDIPEKTLRHMTNFELLNLQNFAQENYSAFPQRLMSISRFALTIINNLTFSLH